MNILEMTEAVYQEAADIRAWLHSHPELSEQEENTSKYVDAVLTKHGIEHKTGYAGYGIVATIGRGPRAIGIRADMDALPILEMTAAPFASLTPGVMHACGHDCHVATACAIGILLKDVEDLITEKGFTVKLFFQPAEETIGGAERMIAQGCMEDPKVETVFGFHVDPTSPLGCIRTKSGPMNAAVCDFTLMVKGVSTHGAHPDMGTDTIVAAADIIMSIQTLVTRRTSPTTPLVITIGAINGGNANNIIPPEVKMLGTIRALDNGVIADTKKLLIDMAEGIAKVHGVTAEFDWDYAFFPALINDPELTDMAKRVMEKLYGPGKVVDMPEASMGADDFAFFSNAARGTFVDIGTTPEGEPVYPIHSDRCLPPQESLKISTSVMTGILFEAMGIEYETL